MSIYDIQGAAISAAFAADGLKLRAAYEIGGARIWTNDPIDTEFSGQHAVWKFKRISNIANVNYSSTDEAAIDYNDAEWETVRVPHDFSIANDFRAASPATYEGGYLDGGDAWYRTSFRVPDALKTDHTALYFDGVYMEADVYLNGVLIGKNRMGYNPFWFDLADKLADDINVLAVFVRNRQPSSRWYSGSGIFRPVYLLGLEKAGLTAAEVQITYPDIAATHAGTVETIISGKLISAASGSKAIKAVIRKGGTDIAQTSQTMQLTAGENALNISVNVNAPELWDVGAPNLYTAAIVCGETEISSTVYGYRWTEWSKDTGFWLNGNNIKLKGVCMHHDLGCIGAEANRSAMERQIDSMVAMGANAIRLTHNPGSTMFLELCRDKGVIVVEELFDHWTVAKNRYDFARYYDEYHDGVIRQTLLRDRNNPAIIMWSIGNEINRTAKYTAEQVEPIVTELIAAVKQYDTTRPVTMGEDTPTLDAAVTCMQLLDVCGINYKQNDLSIPHNLGKPSYGSETTSALSSRGIYAHDDEGYQCSSFDDDKVNWGSYAAVALKAHMDSAYSGGIFVWTGWDYIGEPTPFNKFPAKSSYFGIVDLAGFPKDVYYMYQSRWTSAPMIHIVPMDWDSWTAGDSVPVWIYSNCASVELIQDGVSLGTKAQADIGDKYQFAWTVTYAKGTLTAKGYDAGGAVVAADEVKSSTGAAAKLILSAYKLTVNASSDDLVFITCDVCDANGVRVAKADNEISFSCTGGTVLGTDNGNGACVENMRAATKSAFSGKVLCVCRHDGQAGDMVITASAGGLSSGTITVTKVQAG